MVFDSNGKNMRKECLILKIFRNNVILIALAVFVLLFSILFNAPVRAAVTIIAASNSDSSWKSQATAVCSGTNDQNTISAYLTAGNTVELAPGTFNISAAGYINPASNSRLYGQGNTTIINLQSSMIYISNKNNVEIDHFKITGTTVGVGAVFIGSSGAAVSGFNIHDILCTITGDQTDFQVYANNYMVSNIVFSRCDASNPDGFGFYIGGEGAPQTVQNITYYKCSVENAGVASSRKNIWATGFDLAETTGLTVNHLYVISCSVNGAWESDYHFEDAPTKLDCVLTGNYATRGGQKPSPTFGWGFVSLTGDVIWCQNTAGTNTKGDLSTPGGVFTPPINYVSGTSKTQVPVSQGNCSGTIINLDSTHKELVLYSNDGNAVNQQIELGATYTGNDGNTYSFNGTRIIAQFTDYAVIRLVQTSVSNLTITTGSLLNGTTGAAYSQTLTATGGTAPYNWSITSGTLPVGLTLSSSGVISGTPTTAGGPTSLTFKVTDSASGTSTKVLPITITTTPTISTSSLPNATIGVAYSQTLTATGGTTPYTWSIVTGALPAGLSLSSSGVISGTPAAAGGPISVTFKVNDSTSASSTKILPITVSSATWDVNKDGIVNVLDMTGISQHWGETGSPGWIAQDVNNDGIINSLDMIIVGQHWTS